MLGHALANNIQASTYMSIEISQSLRSFKQINQSDIMSHYLYLYHTLRYPMGETTRLVYEELREEIKSKKEKLSLSQFVFPVERIHQASENAHRTLRGLSAGCNPAQRSYPLALCSYIEDEQLFELSCEEARLTHFNPQAGQVAGIINLICRRLITGDDWNVAVKFAFDNAPPNLPRDIKEIEQRYEHDPVLNPTASSGFAPNVLHTTLYCVTNNDSYESALKRAYDIERDHCPTLVGLLAGARWGVPKSVINNSHSDRIPVLKDIAKYFTEKWQKKWTKNKK
jgi:ADP-ribosylglycohydrolase